VREEAISADGTRVPMVAILPPGDKRATATPTLPKATVATAT
jgi:hypothetical protein